MDTLQFASRLLQNNPLGDPVTRRIAVFLPDAATNNSPLPIVYYLPGFGNSSENAISNPTNWLRAVDRIARDVRPVMIVIPDARTRWLGSQYLNSSAQGNYADYICEEVVSQVESHYGVAAGGSNRIIAGHSSGGFGALRLGMMKPRLFGAVIALSPDSDFNQSHWPLVVLPAVTNMPPARIQSLMRQPPGSPPPENGDLLYALALSAAYAPRGVRHPGEFDWICDATGRVRTEVWKRWLANDPLTLVSRKKTPFGSWQKVCVEGAAQDEYGANVGARKIYNALLSHHVPCAFFEPPGHHNDHVMERLQRGLAWVFDRPASTASNTTPHS